jgi:hypothetical protein
LKVVLLSASAAIAVCLGYLCAGPIVSMMSGEAESTIPVSSFEDAKTDFISVAIFDGGKVRGYISFRVAFSISDESRTPEVGYLSSDIAMRQNFPISEIGTNLPAISKKFEHDIREQIASRLPANLVENVRVIDLAFDARI